MSLGEASQSFARWWNFVYKTWRLGNMHLESMMPVQDLSIYRGMQALVAGNHAVEVSKSASRRLDVAIVSSLHGRRGVQAR